jgi:hypothetical protein
VSDLSKEGALSDLLGAVNESEMWVAVEVGRDLLMTTHAIGLRDSIGFMPPGLTS